MIEKRVHPRIDCQIDLSFSAHDDDHIVETANISESGILFRSNQPLKLMTEYEIAFTLPDVLGSFLCHATVIWYEEIPGSDDHMIGLLFTQIKDEEKSKIKNFIEQMTGDGE